MPRADWLKAGIVLVTLVKVSIILALQCRKKWNEWFSFGKEKAQLLQLCGTTRNCPLSSAPSTLCAQGFKTRPLGGARMHKYRAQARRNNRTGSTARSRANQRHHVHCSFSVRNGLFKQPGTPSWRLDRSSHQHQATNLQTFAYASTPNPRPFQNDFHHRKAARREEPEDDDRG